MASSIALGQSRDLLSRQGLFPGEVGVFEELAWAVGLEDIGTLVGVGIGNGWPIGLQGLT